MSDAICPFCLRDERPMTREHVFAHWLVAKVHGARLVPSRAGADAPRIARVVATVCADCNAGWMSGLEVGFRRLVFARMRSGPIAAVDRAVLARWYTKTAALLASAESIALVEADRLPALRAGMPDDVEVYIARRRRSPQLLDFTFDRDRERLRAVAIAVDDLIAHVALRGTLSGRHGTRLWPARTHALRWDTLPVIGTHATLTR